MAWRRPRFAAISERGDWDQEAAERTDNDQVKPYESAYVERPESDQVDQKPECEADRNGQEQAHHTQRIGAPGIRQGEADGDGANEQRRQAAGQQLERRTAQVTCPPGELQVHRSGEVDGDVTAADALGNIDPCEQRDGGEQRLA
jgi:hypothetical protein